MSEDNDSSSEDSAGSDVEDDVGTEPASTFFPILDSVNSSGGAAAAAAAAALKEGDQVEENGCEGESDASAVSDDEVQFLDVPFVACFFFGQSTTPSNRSCAPLDLEA